jgi:outer membrane protein assembly factor BamE (lipoprotein component of BamABCDE complex)
MKTTQTHCSAGSRRLWIALLVLGLSAASVTEDASTGKLVPRGDQKFPFEEVEEAAGDLTVGMSKSQVLFLLGSPAEMSETGNEWVYLPERYAILIPARALHLEFQDGALAEHGFRPIVLGARL